MLYTNRSRAGKVASWLSLFVLVTPRTAIGEQVAAIKEMPAVVRSSDHVLSELLKEGYGRSTTFRRLVNGISVTTTLVYVEQGICAFGHFKACLLLSVAATDKGRYLRILLTRPVNFRDRNRLIALIGHELQHALEVAERPEVVDADGMMEMYRRIGVPLKDRSGYETSEARAVGDAVLDELEKSPGCGEGPRLLHGAAAEMRERALPVVRMRGDVQ